MRGKTSIEGATLPGTSEETWQYDFIIGLAGKLLISPPPNFFLKTAS